MGEWNKDLTGEALAIAGSTAKRLRVMAGPGTGKSFALKKRVIRLVEEEKVDPQSVLAVTFTRTAANDLKKELKNLGVSGGEKIHAMTLHAYCFALLNQKEVFEKLKRNPRPLKTFNKKGSPQFELSPLLADLDLIQDFGNKRDKFKRLKAFEAAWARTQTEELWIKDDIDRAFHEAIISWLRAHDSMLIGELVPLSLSYAQNNPESDILKKFTHVVVDEYQDLNKAEQVLIDLLSESGGLSIVGDEDQSIYSFRCAHPDGIKDFSVRHDHVEDKTLDECRRCAKRIVSIADSLIKHNHPSTVPSRLKPLPTKDEGNVQIVQWASADDEARGIAQLVQSLVKGGYNPGDILILSPRRLLGYKLRDLIQNEAISVHSFFHEEAVEEIEAQLSVTLLNLLVEPNDPVALRFWLGFGSKNHRSNQYKILLEIAKSEGVSVKAILDQCVQGKRTVKRITQLLESYQNLLKNLDELKSLSIAAVIEKLFPEGKEETRVLREAALLVLKKQPDSDIESLWENIEAMLTQPEMPEEGDFVRIMSMHKSKGLTSRATIITSCIEGLIPNVDEDAGQQEQDESIREQRRLFYVALTRAKELLVLSSFNQIPIETAFKVGAEFTHRGTFAETIACRFMDELGPKKPHPISGLKWQQANFKLDL